MRFQAALAFLLVVGAACARAPGVTDCAGAAETPVQVGPQGIPTADTPCAAAADSLIREASAWYTGTAGSVDDVRARALLEQARGTGSPVATMWIARVHSTGRMGYERDSIRARALASEVIEDVGAAAEAGWTEAVFLMGTAHDEGLGVPVDPAAAAPWFERAAARGHVLATHNLGNAYFAGRGLPQSDSLAVQWWQRAAEAGDAIPQLRLARMYQEGRGTPADSVAARHWYRQAAGRGNQAAKEALAAMDEG